MAKDYARAFYNSGVWKKTQALYLESQNYICEDCGGVACIVHHIKHIAPDNIEDPEITLDWDNLKAVCYECHAIEHMGSAARLGGIAFDADGNVVKRSNVFLVCGSPGSGKSAYISKQKGKADLVIDLDYLCAALYGEPGNLYQNNEPILSVALEMRGLLYQIIKARRGKWARAFVVTTIANIAEQRAIANEINAEIILINTPLEECIERIRADQRRAGTQKLFEGLAAKWHQEYKKSLEYASNPPTFQSEVEG